MARPTLVVLRFGKARFLSAATSLLHCFDWILLPSLAPFHPLLGRLCESLVQIILDLRQLPLLVLPGQWVSVADVIAVHPANGFENMRLTRWRYVFWKELAIGLVTLGGQILVEYINPLGGSKV